MCLTHASRTHLVAWQTGEYKQGTYPKLGDNPLKSGIIPDIPPGESFSVLERPCPHQLVGKVKAYQGYDG